jgi:hypothetical protein
MLDKAYFYLRIAREQSLISGLIREAHMGQETNKKTNTDEEKKRGSEAPAWQACATVLAAIITGLFALAVASVPLIREWFESTPTPSPTVSISATSTLAITETNAPIQTILPSTPTIAVASHVPTATNTLPAPTATSSLPVGMQVILFAKPASGKAPLTVKFDARDSFVRAPDGAIFHRMGGACRYSWIIYLNGEPIRKPDADECRFEHRFDKKGTYFISVYICHGSKEPTCASGGASVEVK